MNRLEFRNGCWICAVAACGLAAACGCQLPAGKTVSPTASATRVPPLSAAVGGSGLLVPAVPRTPVAASADDALIPPAPDEVIQQAGYGAPSIPPAPTREPPMVPPAVMTNRPLPGAVPLPPPSAPILPSPSMPFAAGPGPEEFALFRNEISRQTRLLTDRVADLERELHETRTTLVTVGSQLHASQAEIARLQQYIAQQQQALQSLDARMQAEQQADLKSLNELNEVLGGLLKQSASRQGAVQ